MHMEHPPMSARLLCFPANERDKTRMSLPGHHCSGPETGMCHRQSLTPIDFWPEFDTNLWGVIGSELQHERFLSRRGGRNEKIRCEEETETKATAS